MVSVPFFIRNKHIGFISTKGNVEELFVLLKRPMYAPEESAIQDNGFRLVDFQRWRGDEETEYWYTYHREAQA
jgi:hypothetical protein